MGLDINVEVPPLKIRWYIGNSGNCSTVLKTFLAFLWIHFNSLFEITWLFLHCKWEHVWFGLFDTVVHDLHANQFLILIFSCVLEIFVDIYHAIIWPGYFKMSKPEINWHYLGPLMKGWPDSIILNCKEAIWVIVYVGWQVRFLWATVGKTKTIEAVKCTRE